MLSAQRIMSAIAADKYSRQKKQARTGQRYYDGMHDILDTRIYYIDKNGILVEDVTKSNLRIPHPFFKEIADQEVSYMLSGGIHFRTKSPELEEYLCPYFGDAFIGQMQELLTDTVVRGFGYLYWYKDGRNRTRFQHADSMGLVEVKDGEADTVNDYVIRYYPVVVEDNRTATRIEVWDKNETYYYISTGGTLEMDKNVPVNPCPHLLYKVGSEYYYEETNRLPFLRLDHDRSRQSGIWSIKKIIDDYDIMNCGLSNNLQDVAEGIYVVKGFKANSLDELIWNVRERKAIGVSEKGDLDIKTINIPYEARKAKMEIDEKNIYRLALAFNSSQSGDGNITNIVLKSRYTLLDMKAKKLIMRLKDFLLTPLEIVLNEINAEHHTAFDLEDVKIEIDPVIPTDEKEDAEIEKLNAETMQTKVGTVLDVASVIDEETLLKEICRAMELDYEEVKEKMMRPDEEAVLREVLSGSVSEAGTVGIAGA